MIKRNLTSYLLILTFFATGCAGRSARPETASTAETTAKPAANPGEMGPPLPPNAIPPMQASSSAAPEGPVGPMPAPGFTPPKDGYVLVLGPGLARAVAYAGVLREMEDKGLPIRAIVGVEMGAVVAGIYGSSNANNLEWELHKFKRGTLLDYSLLGFSGKIADGNKLYDFLDDALKVDLLQKMKIPTLIASTVRNVDGVMIEGNGSAKDIIRGAMGIPGVLKPFDYEGKERESASLQTPFPVEAAKNLALGKVLCVDVVGRGDNFTPKEPLEEHLSALMRSVGALARQELKDCDIVLSVPADGISYLNFDAKADLIYQGRLAVRKWLEQPK